MPKLILNDKCKHSILTIFTVIKVSINNKVYLIPNKGQKIVEISKGEHSMRIYKNKLSREPEKKINISEEVTEIDIKENKELLLLLAIMMLAVWMIMSISVLIPFLIFPTVIIGPIITYIVFNKRGTYVFEIKKSIENVDKNNVI